MIKKMSNDLGECVDAVLVDGFVGECPECGKCLKAVTSRNMALNMLRQHLYSIHGVSLDREGVEEEDVVL